MERTIGWVSRYRRLSKEYEARPAVEEAWIHLAMIGLMTQRLTRLDASETPSNG